MGKRPKPKLSKTLDKRTRLSPGQLSRVAGGYGGGAIAKYGADGVQNLALTRAYAKALRTAKRYVLFTDRLGRRMYVADRNKMNLRDDEQPLTFLCAQALEFVEGLDSVDLKKAYYRGLFVDTLGLEFEWLTKTI